MPDPRFEIVITSAGAVSILNTELGEIMHNPVGPWREANALYIEQSQLAATLTAIRPDDEFVIFDVGLGAAANALATLHLAQTFPQARLRLVSFERDLELASFALEHAEKFPHFRGWEEALAKLLNSGVWEKGTLRWELRHGDFLETIRDEQQKAHLIFYDPYSSKVNGEMWTPDCFRKIRAACRESGPSGTRLFTYSQATPVRVALLTAGFYVGHGQPTGLKEETTQAATSLDLLAQPLGSKWFERWRKSHRRHPPGVSPTEQSALDHLVMNHPQFSSEH